MWTPSEMRRQLRGGRGLAACIAVLGPLLLVGCGGPADGPAAPQVTLSAPPREISLVIGPREDPYVRAVVAGARAAAARAAVGLRVEFDTDVPAQRRSIVAGITRRDRAVVVAPVDYLGVYLQLRTAHDQDVPSFVLDLDPPPATNQAYVWSFLSTGRPAAAAVAARALARRVPLATEVVVVSSGGYRSGLALSVVSSAERSLASALPGATVRRALVSAGDVAAGGVAAGGVADVAGMLGGTTAVLAVDEVAGEVVAAAVSRSGRRDRVTVVALGATQAELATLRTGVLDELVVPRAAELGRLAVRYALQSAANRPEEMPRTVTLPPIRLTATDLGTARERAARYPVS